MIYLDNGATSFPKPAGVGAAMAAAVHRCANPGRGGYGAAMAAAEVVFRCRTFAAELFGCGQEQVVFTPGCTYGLNVAIRTLLEPGDRVVISGFEHNAVTRPLWAMGAETIVAGRRLFDWDDTLEQWEQALKSKPKAAVFTHVSNVFGYILPVDQMSALCRRYGVPFAVDAAQSAGMLPVEPEKWDADFVAMPGHKGLLGPQGTGILVCRRMPVPLIAGGTGSESHSMQMPDYLPDRAEAGTVNVPGIAGLSAGLESVAALGIQTIFQREREQAAFCADKLNKMGMHVFSGPHQSGTLSFLPGGDCEATARELARLGIAVRAGLHCAPLAHESAGTAETGTVRLSFGHRAGPEQSRAFLRAMNRISPGSP